MAETSELPWGSTHQPEWVEATPFRAHARHLIRAANLTSPVLAELTGVPARAVDHLLHGRFGRPVRKLCADHARRLLRVTTSEARQLRVRPVPAATTRRRLRAMLAHGWRADDLARAVGMELIELEALAKATVTTCPQLVALQVSAVYTRLGLDPDLIEATPVAQAA